MRQILFILVTLLAVIGVNAQDASFSAILLSLKGEGTCTVNKTAKKLALPMSFNKGDEVLLKSGSATLMLMSGKEINLTVGKKYVVPAVSIDSEELLAIADVDDSETNLLSQSSYSFKTRGPARHVFPSKSKCVNTSEIVLYIKEKPHYAKTITIKIIDEVTQKVIWEKTNVTDSVLVVKEANFTAGKTYYWRAFGLGAMPEMGTIVIEKESDNSNTVLKESNHAECLSNIVTAYKAGYNFKAIMLAKKYADKFPESNLYEALVEKLMQ